MQDSPQFSIREKSKSELSDGKISAKTLFDQSDNHYEIKSTTKQLKYKIQVGMLETANVLNISKKILFWHPNFKTASYHYDYTSELYTFRFSWKHEQ